MNRLSLLLVVLGALASLVAATCESYHPRPFRPPEPGISTLTSAPAAPTFCKCTCFTNSTIIEIKPKTSTSTVSSSHLKEPDEPTDTDTDTTAAESFVDAFLSSPDHDESSALERRKNKHGRASLSPSCSQCNRAFCLSQSLPICKGAGEKDVVTSCFQRDSRQDMIIVWGFILGTGGLLGWAGVRKLMEMQDRPGGIAGGIAGSLQGRHAGGGGLNIVGRGGLGSTGVDAGRGRYAGLSAHSRESSSVMG